MKIINVSEELLEHFHKGSREAIQTSVKESKIKSYPARIWIVSVPFEDAGSLDKVKYHTVLLPHGKTSDLRHFIFMEAGSDFQKTNPDRIPLLIFVSYEAWVRKYPKELEAGILSGAVTPTEENMSSKEEVIVSVAASFTGIATYATAEIKRVKDFITLEPFESGVLQVKAGFDRLTSGFFRGFAQEGRKAIEAWNSRNN